MEKTNQIINVITKDEVIKAQEIWGKAIIEIGSLKNNRISLEKKTKSVVNELYAFELGTVLFKPTKAAENQFRLTKNGAVSYFIGDNKNYPEDKGFALEPWIKVRFENAEVILENNRALAMGNYYFTDQQGNKIKVEYTFGYIKDSNQKLRIDVHHSSVPYKN